MVVCIHVCSGRNEEVEMGRRMKCGANEVEEEEKMRTE